MAKQHSGTRSKGASRQTKKNTNQQGLSLFIIGAIFGVVICLLIQKAIKPASNDAAPIVETQPDTSAPESETKQKPPIDFYKRLLDTEVLVELEKIEPRDAKTFVLQAASFRQKEDADRARAEIILMNPVSYTHLTLPTNREV